MKVSTCKGFTVQRTKLSNLIISLLRKHSVSLSVWPWWDFCQGFWSVCTYARRCAMLQYSSIVQEWKKGAELQKAWRVPCLLYTTTMAMAVFGHRQSRHCQASAISKQAPLPFRHSSFVSAKALGRHVRAWCWGWDCITTARWGDLIYLQWSLALTVPLSVVRTTNHSFQYSSQLLLHFLPWELASPWPPNLWPAILNSACIL